MNSLFAKLHRENIKFYLSNFSSLDVYFKTKKINPVYLITDSSLGELAGIFKDIRYPGLINVDACVISEKILYLFQCVDDIYYPPKQLFRVQNFYYDPFDKIFHDPYQIYYSIKKNKLEVFDEIEMSLESIIDAAILTARYGYKVNENFCEYDLVLSRPKISFIRESLINILMCENPDRAFNFLKELDFLKIFLPEINGMYKITHTKDYHPEGDLWHHTMEALKHRKNKDITLSLAILLHDIGKTATFGSRDKPFEEHANIGAMMTKKFLKKLEFDDDIIKDVAFLVENHMMVPAMEKMPLYRIEKLMRSRLFPLLLELYRADVCSSYEDQQKYFDACRLYRIYLKKSKNPYKELDLSQVLS